MLVFPLRTFGTAAVLTAVATLNLRAAPGDLDPTFGDGGIAVHTDAALGFSVADMKALADGKLLVAGTVNTGTEGNRDFALRRFHTDGKVDLSFGVNGLAVASIDSTDGDYASAMAIQAGGKIVVAGTSRDAVSGYQVFALLRFNSNGTLDTNFSGDGRAVYEIAGVDCEAAAVATLSDGKILVLGQSGINGYAGKRMALLRVNVNGSVDRAFGPNAPFNDGWFTDDFGFGGQFGLFKGLAVQPDGKILAAGTIFKSPFGFRGFIVRLTPSGRFDLSFDYDGKVAEDYYLPRSIVLQKDGKIITGGSTRRPDIISLGSGDIFRIKRYEAWGSGGDSVVAAPHGMAPESYVADLALQPDGKLVAAGAGWITAGYRFVVSRYDTRGTLHPTSGSLDPTFGTLGAVFTGIPGLPEFDALSSGVASMVLLPDSRVVLASWVNEALVLIRYKGVPAEIAVFNGAAQPTNELQDNVGTVNLGTSALGTGTARTIIIKNTAAGTLSGLSVSKSGPDHDDFFLDTKGMASALKKDATTTFKVVCKPSVLGDRTAVLLINSTDDDEHPFRIQVTASGVNTAITLDREAEARLEDSTVITLPVRLSAPAGGPFSVPVVYGGSAANLSDYTCSATVLPFSADQRQASIVLKLKDDLVVEGNETLTVELGVPSIPGVVRSDPLVFTLTITEDDVMPIIQAQPTHQLLAAGATATFISGATGSDPLTLQWKKGTAILHRQTGPTLNLPLITLSSAGTYTMVARNQRGAVNSNKAELGIVDVSDQIHRSDVGGQAKLTLLAAGNLLTYQWHGPSGTALTNTAKFAGVTTPTLTVKSTQVSDIGLYRCQVSGPGGNTLLSGTHELQVPVERPDALQPAFPDVVVFNRFSYQLPFDNVASKAPTKFVCTGLPKGVICNPATGLVSGVPRTPGDYQITVMISNAAGAADVVMTDTFTVLPFPAAAVGAYVGLIARDTLTNADLGGRVDLTVTQTGSYTGILRAGKLTQALRGMLITQPGPQAHPTSKHVIARAGNLPLELTLNLDSANDSFSGSLIELGAAQSAAVTGWRNRWSANNPPPQTGLHAAEFTVNPPSTSAAPQGHGFCTFAVGSNGTTTVKGMTADGATILSSGLMGPSGEVIVYQGLYASRGSILGRLAVAPDSAHTVTGSLEWQRTQAGASVRDYPPFGPLAVKASGGTYEVTTPILGLIESDEANSNARLLFSGGGIEASQTNPDVSFWVSGNNTIHFPGPGLGNLNPGKITALKLNLATGAFSGRLTLTDLPHSPRLVGFKGQLVSSNGKGYGHFLLPQLPDPLATPPTTKTSSPILSGQVILQAAP